MQIAAVKQWSLQVGNLVKQVKMVLEIENKNRINEYEWEDNTKADYAKNMILNGTETLWANSIKKKKKSDWRFEKDRFREGPHWLLDLGYTQQSSGQVKIIISTGFAFSFSSFHQCKFEI